MKRLLILTLCVLLCMLISQNFKIVVAAGPSMEPTISPNDRFLFLRYSFSSPAAGDIALIQKGSKLVIKRISACPGDIPATDNYYWGSKEVPPGRYFVTGDNPEHSTDSRSPQWGLISESEIWGRLFLPLS